MKKLLRTTVLAALIAVTTTACNPSILPKPCVELAREHGAPEGILEIVQHPAGTHDLERLALRVTLETGGFGKACSAALE